MYPWSQRGRGATTSSSTPYTAPSNFASGPSWAWKNELDEQVRHSPLIDNNMDIYVTTATRIRKFSQDGQLLWTWQSSAEDGKMVASPALYEGAIFAVSWLSPKKPKEPTEEEAYMMQKAAEKAAMSEEPQKQEEPPDPGHITMFSIDMERGATKWKKTAPFQQHSDASSIFVYNSTMIVPLKNDIKDKKANITRRGNNIVYAVNISDGSALWEYSADDNFANFAPATPGDGTLLVAGNCGSVFRMTFGGELIWRKGEAGSHTRCSNGGGALGSNGVFYVEYEDVARKVKNNSTSAPKFGARLAAYQVSDGQLLWKRTFEASEHGIQYPAVGRLGHGGPLAVVVAVGQQTPESPDGTSTANDHDAELYEIAEESEEAEDEEEKEEEEDEDDDEDEKKSKKTKKNAKPAEDEPKWAKYMTYYAKKKKTGQQHISRASLVQTSQQGWGMGDDEDVPAEEPSEPVPKPRLSNAVVALDATTGKVLWRFDEEPWSNLTAAGESELYQERKKRAERDWTADVICKPEAQGIPVIAGDGTVYMSSGQSGNLRAIRDADGDGVIDSTETSAFKTHNCFRNSPSLAPGMLVAAPCWGPMYVFKTARI